MYDEHRRGLIAKSDMRNLKGKLEPFGWNDYLIRAEGPVITLFINGIQTIQAFGRELPKMYYMKKINVYQKIILLKPNLEQKNSLVDILQRQKKKAA